MPAIRNTNDGSQSAPYLRLDMNMGCLADPPESSTVPRGSHREVLQGIKKAGYAGTQGGDIEICKELGLGCTTSGRVNQAGEIAPLAAKWKKAGYEAATLHVGWGHEDDATIDILIKEIIAASLNEDLPIYVETHRATITQDTWRTVKMVERNPDIRINADYSHWYTGLEMPYGNIEDKFNFVQPVFDRVRFFHGRCGNSGSMQTPWDHPSMEKALAHFKTMWTRSMTGFLNSAKPGDFLSFNPELLHPAINYAPVSKQTDGSYSEGSDRWVDAKLMTDLAKECFADAQQLVRGSAHKA